ncbi:hypothetical protein [Ammoniphilus sp. CFH 90114]|uniref:hypothetical protein n=1 Tax=Ammoniphilus sp. CFH 90114 TaxID=2493665 RepID=UPI00100E6383|nr:hypothetical protein [Ammoniphilus sp. CFH 90114]RXT08826.1 hypothetical protein EIZ39_08480 [Ammoniphilus sp. CFH 90114]
MKEAEIKRGQPVTFRIPSDTPEHILRTLQQLKKTERRNFSSKIAEFVINGVSGSISRQRETLTIPLPKGLSKAQRDWLKHEHSEALLGSIVYQLLANPVRTASLFTSINSNALEIDEALYLQEEVAVSSEIEWDTIDSSSLSSEDSTDEKVEEDDLDNFNWETAIRVETPYSEKEEEEEEEEGDLDDLLGDFLAQMNK